MALDPAAVAKYGYAGALRRSQRQALGVSDVRKLSPRQLQSYRQGGSGITKGLGFDFGRKPPGQAGKSAGQGGPAGGRPVAVGGRGGPAGGRPVLQDDLLALIAQKRNALAGATKKPRSPANDQALLAAKQALLRGFGG